MSYPADGNMPHVEAIPCLLAFPSSSRLAAVSRCATAVDVLHCVCVLPRPRNRSVCETLELERESCVVIGGGQGVGGMLSTLDGYAGIRYRTYLDRVTGRVRGWYWW